MPPLTHVFFDFFGTLVTYSKSLVEQGYDGSYEVLTRARVSVDYSGFLERWSDTFEEFELRAQQSLDEFSMDEVCAEFLRRVLPQPASAEVSARFRDTYLMEWNRGVEYIPGVPALLADLSECFTLALVTNTHHADLVDRHLEAMDATQYFSTVVHSVKHGKRKPSRSIFESAIERSGAKRETSVYVGDSYSADYLGAVGAGLRGLLIDSERRHDVPRTDRLADVLEARALLAG